MSVINMNLITGGGMKSAKGFINDNPSRIKITGLLFEPKLVYLCETAWDGVVTYVCAAKGDGENLSFYCSYYSGHNIHIHLYPSYNGSEIKNYAEWSNDGFELYIPATGRSLTWCALGD